MIELKPKAAWKKINHPLGGDWYRWGEVQVHIAKENGYWHLSISHSRRHPTWDEIYTAWYDLVPGAGREFNGAIILPRKAEYVNLHPNCFHIHQLSDEEMPVFIL